MSFLLSTRSDVRDLPVLQRSPHARARRGDQRNVHCATQKARWAQHVWANPKRKSAIRYAHICGLRLPHDTLRTTGSTARRCNRIPLGCVRTGEEGHASAAPVTQPCPLHTVSIPAPKRTVCTLASEQRLLIRQSVAYTRLLVARHGSLCLSALDERQRGEDAGWRTPALVYPDRLPD